MKIYRDDIKHRGWRFILHVLAGLVMAVAFGILFGYFIMLLWNNLLPDLFGWKQITFLQGIGLVILCRLLFGSHGCHRRGHHGPGRFGKGRTGHHPFWCDRKGGRMEWWENEGKESLRQYLKKKGESVDDSTL